MLFDGVKLIEGSNAENLTVASGSAFPSSPTEGEIFYRNDGANEGLYVYDGSTWVKPSGSSAAASLEATYVGFGDANGNLTGSAKLKWLDATTTLQLGDTGAGATLRIQPTGVTNGAGNALNITAGAAGTVGNGGALTLSGGASAGASPAVGGAVNITGGTGTQTGGAINITGGTSGSQGGGGDVVVKAGTSGAFGNAGGSLTLASGTNSQNGAGGAVIISTAAGNTLTERVRILNNGAWSVGSNGTSYGTSGQVLTSNGNAAPTWQDVVATIPTTLSSKTLEDATFTNGYTEEVYTANSSTAFTVSLANGSMQIVTLTGNCTFTFPTATAGKSFTLLLLQDATGSRTAAWPGAVKWAGGSAPTITATATKGDKLIFTADGTFWWGTVAGQNY